MRNKSRREQKDLAVAICRLADVPLDRRASLNDVEASEEALKIRVMLVSARLGNKFITSPSSDERPCIYLYLVDDSHFHSLSYITEFFRNSYLFEKCLNHYSNREYHLCKVSCIVCKTRNCPKTVSPFTCSQCNMTCRSMTSYNRHTTKSKNREHSECKKWWTYPTCYKVINTDKRKKEDHVCGAYLCSSCDK